jgi:pre-mRNA cleavage complex 2 protein Pcf11
MSSMHTLASRLRQDTTNRSRSGTPDACRATPPKGNPGIRSSQSRSPDSKRATLKRKASVDDFSRSPVKMESNGTPPMKKMALAA